MTARSAIRKPPALDWPVRSILSAALLTLGTYVLLPCLETLSQRPRAPLALRSVDTVRPPPPALPLPPRPMVPQAEEPPLRKPPKPGLPAEPQARVPISLPLNLALSPGDVRGDFTLNFALAPPETLAAPDDMVFELSDLDEPPLPLVRLRPIYPARARMRQTEGFVVLEFVVGADGKPRDVEVLTSSPEATFGDAAVRAVSRWRFRPGTREGAPVPVRVRQKVSFRLEERP